MNIRANAIIAMLLSSLLGACGGDPVDASGQYSIAVTNGENGCAFADWSVGESTANIPVTITQDGVALTATVEGVVGVFLELALGAKVYQGELDGSSLELTLFGERSVTEGNCAYTINSVIEAEIDGDVLTGRIEYRKAGNGNPDCAAIEGCATVQSFNGTRPPKP